MEAKQTETEPILLTIDSCSAHLDLPDFSGIKVVYVPAEILQPLDQGIIKSFKVGIDSVLMMTM